MRTAHKALFIFPFAPLFSGCLIPGLVKRRQTHHPEPAPQHSTGQN